MSDPEDNQHTDGSQGGDSSNDESQQQQRKTRKHFTLVDDDDDNAPAPMMIDEDADDNGDNNRTQHDDVDGGDEPHDHTTTTAADGGGGGEGVEVDQQTKQRMLEIFGSDSEGEDAEGREGTAPHAGETDLSMCFFQAPPDGTTMFLSKIPWNILGIEPTPFDSATYEEEEAEIVTEDGKRRIRNRENVLRWRFSKTEVDPATNEPLRESNARFVEWSDGSILLLVGNEVFDVNVQDISKTDNSYVFSRWRHNMQCHGKLRQKMAFRPISLESSSHRLLSDEMKNRGYMERNRKVRMVHTSVDPEQQKAQMEAAEEQRIRASQKIERRVSGTTRASQLTADYLEAGLDDATTDVGAVRAAFKRGASVAPKVSASTSLVGRKREREEERDAERRILQAKTSENDIPTTRAKGRAIIDDDDE
eukprot:gnl/Spiro4/2148_TR1026_c0_g1_i1.p1 gnl/Spiro4/2148_TR1026_c0_g1~~gnl/Spiro4/2148_TR1026_c0_g1_i1.p1  ORF type:complete len:445 (+),score=125.31 gnl/Spiro4/2148_TR1026_c0_g1_i1:77-1336(+)